MVRRVVLVMPVVASRDDLDRRGTAPRVLGGLATAIAATVYLWSPAATSMRSLAGGLSAAWFGLLVACWSSRRGLADAKGLYLLLFGLFHGGLVFATALVGASAWITQVDVAWINPISLKPAVEAVAVAMVAFGIGALMAPRVSLQTKLSEEIVGARVRVAGTALVVASLAAMGPALVPQGFGLLSLGYADFYLLAQGRLFAFGLPLLATGCGLLVAAGGGARRWGWGIFAVSAIILLPIGLRGPVMFAAAALVVVEGRRHRIGPATLVPAFIAALTLASVIRQTRAGGLGALLDPRGLAIAPMQGLAEMGYSIRPVVVVQSWLDAGEPTSHGMTLIAPVLRMVERLGGQLPIDFAEDFRLFSVEILYRAGPIGGSPVAEGMRNGGVVFAAVLLFVLGLIVGTLDRLPQGVLGSTIVVLVLTPMLAGIRNDFAPVLARWIVGGVILLLILAWPVRDKPRSPHDP